MLGVVALAPTAALDGTVAYDGTLENRSIDAFVPEYRFASENGDPPPPRFDSDLSGSLPWYVDDAPSS